MINIFQLQVPNDININPKSREKYLSAMTAPEVSELHVHVATITKEMSLDDVFDFTQHINFDWTSKDDVVALIDNQRIRSSSVGDIFQIGDENFKVEMFGFKKFPKI